MGIYKQKEMTDNVKLWYSSEIQEMYSELGQCDLAAAFQRFRLRRLTRCLPGPTS